MPPCGLLDNRRSSLWLLLTIQTIYNIYAGGGEGSLLLVIRSVPHRANLSTLDHAVFFRSAIQQLKIDNRRYGLF